MKKKYIFFKLLIPLLLLSGVAMSQTMMPLPAHNSTYSTYARGYWFIAPTSFTITGLRVPSEAGTGSQYIHVMKTHDPFPIATSGSTNFTTLTYIPGAPNGVIQSVNIPVNAGDTIGILGTAGQTNSYTASAAHTSTIAGFTVNLNRLGYQGDIDGGPAPEYWGVADGASGSISRIEMYYTTSACTAPPTAGVASANPSSGVCLGTQVQLSLTGNSFGSGQTYQWEASSSATGPWTAIGTAGSSPFETISASTSTYYRAAVTCSGQTVYSDSVLVTVNPAFPGGTYTINSAQPTGGSNFQSFTDAINAISCGITGAVTFNVTPGSGPYNEKVTIPQIGGASASNPVTINGNGAEIAYMNTNSSDRGILTLDGADHIVIDSLMVTSTGNTTSEYGIGILLTNDADSNIISNNIINVDTVTTSSNYAGIALSGATSSPTSSGSNSDGNLITGNIVNGGYYGITAYTTSDNIISNNEVRNFYIYGVYSNTNTNLLIEANDIHREDRTTVSSFYAVYQTGVPTGNRISRNIIHDAFTGNPFSTSVLYAIYITGSDAAPGNETIVSNNVLYDLNGGGTIYALYNSSSNGVYYYHNTISIDDVNFSGSSVARGLYQTTTASNIEFKNNIVYIIRGGTGTNHGVYFNTAGSTWISDNNDFYIAGTGTNYIGRASATNHATLASWQLATGQDTASFTEPPMFANLPGGDLTPSNAMIDDQGTPVGITVDVLNNPRSTTTPDMGAYEFSVPPCAGIPVAGTASGPAGICAGDDVLLSLSGFTIGQGINIQWQYFDPAFFVWMPIAGATTPNYAVSGQTTATDYRAVVTCTNGGATDISNTVSVAMNSFINCYCTSNATNVNNEEIWNVSLGLLNNSSDCSTGNQLYTDYTSVTPANLPQNSNTPISLTLGTCGSAGTSVAIVYIDYNQNGLFTDPGEEVFITTPATSSTAPGAVETGNVSVPASALLGTTGMRVVYERTSSAANVNPCGTYTYGETEDYRVTIVPPPACTSPGIPAASNLTATSADVTWTPSLSTPASGYEWRLFPVGSGPYGTPVASGFEPAGDTVASLTGLTATTDYAFFVRALCTTTDTSTWVSDNFMTPCASFTAPFLETFDNTTTPLCWTNTGSENWIFSTGAGYNAANAGDHTGNSGNYAWVDGSTPNNSGTTLTSPVIDLSTLTTPRLRYYIFSNNVNTTANNEFIVQVLDNGVWTTIDSVHGNLGPTWVERTAMLTGMTSPTIQLRFIVNEETANSPFYNDILIDDIYVEQAPTCIATGTPSVITTQGTNATIEWTSSPSNPANGYIWAVFPSGSGPNGTSVVSGTEPAGDTTASITGLTAGTSYTFYVRALCSATDSSFWKDVTFAPTCDNPTSLTVTTTTTTGGTATFVGSSSTPAAYQYRVVATPGAATDPAADSGFVTGTTINFSNLMPATAYELYVRSICAPGDTATTWTSVSVQTQCIPFPAPYFHDVESQNANTNSTMNNCWTSNPSGTSGVYAWHVSGTGTTTSTNTGPSSAYSGNKFFFTEASYGSQGAVAELISPVIDLSTVTAPTVDFYYHMWGPDIDKLVVSVSDNGGASWTPVDSLIGQQQANQTDPWLLRTIPLTGYTGNIQVMFAGTRGSGFGGDIAIDNFAVNGVPLAIKLVSITAANAGSKNRIDWNTASEEAGDKFILERSSDGRQYSDIAAFDAKGEASAYTYWDEQPVAGVNYYRLRLVDANGAFEYSKVVTATVKGSGSFTVEAFPNPVKDELTINVYGGSDNAKVIVTDVTGKAIRSVTVVSGTAKVDMNGLAQGMYLVHYSDDNHTETIKVNKQ